MLVLLIIDLWYEEGFLCIFLFANHVEIGIKYKHEKRDANSIFQQGLPKIKTAELEKSGRKLEGPKIKGPL